MSHPYQIAPKLKKQKVMLWFAMRSCSTAFARAISQLDNTRIIFEPFYSAYAYGPERKLDFRSIAPLENQITYQFAKDLLEESDDKYRLVFSKDCTSGFPKNKFKYVPDGFKHVFLIRKPTDICLSLQRSLKNMPGKKAVFSNYDVDDLVGYKNMVDLYQFLAAKSEQPLVLDADLLISNPKKILTRFFDYLGLEFNEAVLNWKKSEAFSSSWWYSKSDLIVNSGDGFYSTATKSTKFENQELEPNELNNLPERYQQAIKHMNPFYNELLKQVEPVG